MGHAFREFRANRSPWIIGAAIVVAAGVRIAMGGFSWRDAVAAAAMLVDLSVRRVGDPRLPAAHAAVQVPRAQRRPADVEGAPRAPQGADRPRADPARPRRGRWRCCWLAVPHGRRCVGAARLADRRARCRGARWSRALLAGYVLVGVYEWTHFLIHTAYRPRSRYYRSIWRTHRLHHFKNEHYWHGITNTVADRVLGTLPDQRAIERSRTARDLVGTASRSAPACRPGRAGRGRSRR